MSRVELFERIRRDARTEGLSIRSLAKRHGVHRRTVRDALRSAVPPVRRSGARAAPQLGQLKPFIREVLEDDLTKPRKQRHTARRIWQRLVDEHGATVAESTVRAYVAEVRAEIGRTIAGVAVPQAHGPGEEAECDFGDVHVYVAGVLTRLYVFCMRLSHSGLGFHRVYANQAQESFLEGHVLAFERFGGVPTVQIRYDNLKAAVASVVFGGRNRRETERFITLRSHYGFDAFFCLPGRRGAHEKGGVEGEVGRFRRRHMVPVPAVSSLAELNVLVEQADRTDNARRIDGRRLTVGESFELERPFLSPLPVEPFDCSSQSSARVDHKARVCVRQCHYSVPARLVGKRVEVRVHATEVVVVHEGRVVATHERAVHKKAETLLLDHYLEVLQVKPGALAGATALQQAKSAGAFTHAHEAFWSLARRRLGDQAGTRALIQVLLAHRSVPATALIESMERSTAAGLTEPDAVIVEARRLADAARAGGDRGADRIDGVSSFDRPAPALDGYDRLISRGTGEREAAL